MLSLEHVGRVLALGLPLDEEAAHALEIAGEADTDSPTATDVGRALVGPSREVERCRPGERARRTDVGGVRR